jgi:hypothetical protein
VILKNSTHTSRRTHFKSVGKTNQLIFCKEIITVYGGNYVTHRIILRFITVLQQLVHTVAIMLQLVDNDGMIMMMLAVVVTMIMMINTRH